MNPVQAACNTYRIFRINGQSVLALPAFPRHLRLASLARFQPFTPTRALYQRLLQLSMFLGADRLLSTTANSPIEPSTAIDFDGWLNQAKHDLSKSDVRAAVMWPIQPNRGRLYVHLFNSQAKPIAFAKLSFDDANDESLQREARIISGLQAMELQECHVPHVLGTGRWQEHTYLILQPVPIDAAPLRPTVESYPVACVEEFSGCARFLLFEQLQQLGWWRQYRQRLNARCEAFDTELLEQVSKGVYVRRAHGDFTSANVVRYSGMPWVFDWEECDEDAPVMADEITFWLALRYRKLRADPTALVHLWCERYCENRSAEQRMAAMLSLAFRASRGIQDARMVIENWRHTSRDK